MFEITCFHRNISFIKKTNGYASVQNKDHQFQRSSLFYKGLIGKSLETFKI